MTLPLRSIIDCAPTALVVCDAEGRVLTANRALATLLGRATPELVGTAIANHFDRDDAPRCAELLRRTLAHEGDGSVDLRVRDAEPTVWCRVRFATVPNGDASGAAVVGVFEDITGHKAAASRSDESSERYRLAVEHANDIIFNIDLSGRFTFVNPTACLLTKYPEEELIGMHYLELIREDFCEAAERLYTDQVTRRIPSTYYEYPIVTRDNEVLWLGQYVQLILEDRRIVSVQAFARDITQRRLAQEALRASEERLRAVVSSVPIILWATDQMGRLTLCEGRALSELGLDTEGCVGRPAAEVIDDPNLGTHLIQAREGESFRTILSLGERVFDSWFAPIHDAKGGQSGVLGVAIDVTEQRGLQDRLFQIEKLEALGQLAGGIAHDFNNQLTAILGYCELLGETLTDGDPRLDDLEEIAKAGRRSAAMTEQLLAYGRKQPRTPQVIDLNETIRNIEALLRSSVPADIEFATRLDESLAPVGVDPTQIEHVLLNLVLNARDAVATGGQITLSTSMLEVGTGEAPGMAPMAPGRYVCVEVADTGSGMDESTRTRVFEPFFTTKEPGKGTGLGLASVYGIVKQNGGYIWVTSRLGEGSTFQICLPARVGRATSSTQRRKSTQGVGGSETIMVVEDDPTVRSLTSGVLSDQGYQVLVAEHAAQALDVSANHEGTIDLLVTDIVMPGMNGRELAGKIRDVRPETRVVFTTGYAREAVTQRQPLRREPLIEKPFVPSSFLRKVRQVLDEPAPGEPVSSS